MDFKDNEFIEKLRRNNHVIHDIFLKYEALLQRINHPESLAPNTIDALKEELSLLQKEIQALLHKIEQPPE